ncbi:MAG: LacI family DNA-binding transcriptional regulator [Mycetocola sp.]
MEKPRSRAVSMADVAVAAGVSGQTVSRVVNGRSNVDPETRTRVEAVMLQLGYRPNSAARALRSGRFRSIGVIVFTLASSGNMSTLNAVASVAAEKGYALTLITVEAATQAAVSRAFGRLQEQGVDGVVILMETHPVDDADFDLPSGLPVVIVDSNAAEPHLVVDTDQSQGATAATAHLLDLGHATVWHIAGPQSSYSAERRVDAWRAELERRGCAVMEPLFGDWSAESGYSLGRVLANRGDVTAVFAANDEMAIGALRAFHEAGIRVPEQVSVVGFDDSPIASSVWPPLTTIRQHFDRVGAVAVQALLADIHGDGAEGRTLIPTELVVRSSTASPPGGDEPAR